MILFNFNLIDNINQTVNLKKAVFIIIGIQHVTQQHSVI